MVSTRAATVSATPRRLLPFVAFLTTFTIVMLLLMSMNLKAQKFHRRLNSSNPFLDLSNLSQEDPILIEFVRKFYLRETPNNNNTPNQLPLKTSPSAIVKYIDKIFHHQSSGIFVEIGAYNNRKASLTEWLEIYQNWTGLLIQGDPRDYQTLLNHNRTRSLLAHACISPIAYVKEATFRSWNPSSTSLFTIVKCFPLFTLISAAKLSTVDLLVISAQGAEVLILKTLPRLTKLYIRCLVVRWTTEQRPQLAEFLGKRHFRFSISFDDLHVFLNEDFR